MNLGQRIIHGAVPTRAGGVGPRDRGLPADAFGAPSPLATSFIEHLACPVGLHAARVPASLNFAALAAYGVARINVERDIGQDCLWTGYKLELSCNDSSNNGEDTDIAAAGAANWAQWGSNKHTKSAVIVGVNLPIVPGEWTDWPNNLSGMRPALAGDGLRQTNHKPEQRVRLNFYPDDINITATNAYPRQQYQTSFLPAAFRLTGSMTLDVALVLDPSVAGGVNGGAANRFLQADVMGELYIGLVQAFNTLRQ